MSWFRMALHTLSDADVLARGIHANVYRIVLGHNTNVLNTETRKVEIINKGTEITIYKVLTCFETFLFSYTRKKSTTYCNQRFTTV